MRFLQKFCSVQKFRSRKSIPHVNAMHPLENKCNYCMATFSTLIALVFALFLSILILFVRACLCDCVLVSVFHSLKMDFPTGEHTFPFKNHFTILFLFAGTRSFSALSLTRSLALSPLCALYCSIFAVLLLIRCNVFAFSFDGTK